MKHTFAIFFALVLALPIFGAPSSTKRHIIKRSATGDKVPDSYIVVMKQGSSKTDQMVQLKAIDSDPAIDGQYKLGYGDEFSGVLNGYSAHLTGAALDHVLSDPNVDWIEENGIMSVKFSTGEASLEDNGPHAELIRGLHERGSLGEGVVIYSIDSGIHTTHQTFGGRAFPGKAFGSPDTNDGFGHGTAVASIAVGNGFGVATAAEIVSIKVLANNGTFTFPDIIAGIGFAVESALADGKPSIILMSYSFHDDSRALDTAIENAISQGVHAVIGAGSDNTDADGLSPARVPSAITIGAVDEHFVKTSFSNFGPVIDCFARGISVKSASAQSETGTQVVRGTDIAAPFAAGLLAISLGNHGDDTPAVVSQRFSDAAWPVVKGAPDGTTNKLCIAY